MILPKLWIEWSQFPKQWESPLDLFNFLKENGVDTGKVRKLISGLDVAWLISFDTNEKAEEIRNKLNELLGFS